MKALGLLVALGVVCLALLVSPQLQERLADRNDYTRQRQELDLQQRQEALERQRQWDAATMPGNVSLYYASAAGGLVLFALLLHYLHEGTKRRGRAFEITTVAGYPVPRAALERGDDFLLQLIERALLADKAAKVEEARRPNVPLHLTYAPKYSNQAPALLDEESAVALANVPSFAELLTRGDIGPGRPLLLGYTAAGAPLHGSWLDLYSTAVGGLPGSGKTTSQRFLAAQSALHGCQFVVVDKHADVADDSLGATLEPLSSVYLCEPASTEKAILEAVRLVADIGEKRIRGQDTSKTPIILWVDEATALLAHSKIGDELATLLEQIAQQYRKRAVYASISGQIWTADRAGSSALRDSLASVLAHRMKRNQARLLVPTDEAVLVERLAPGRALLWRSSGQSEVITMPNTVAADVGRVAGLLTLQPTVEAPMKHLGSTVEAVNTAPASVRPQTASAARILSAFQSGVDISEIAKEIAQTGSGGKYWKALAEVNRVLREEYRAR